MTAYVVTTSIRGISRTQVWNPSSPLLVGHPLHWVVEKTGRGVRARNISGQLNETRSNGLCEIEESALQKGVEIQLPSLDGRKEADVLLKIRPTQDAPPIFSYHEGDALVVYACVRDWVLGSAPLENSYIGEKQKKKVFKVTRAGQGISIEPLVDGLTLTTRTGARELKLNEKTALESADIASSRLQLGLESWLFGYVKAPSEGIVSRTSVSHDDHETLWFSKSLRYAGATFAAFMALAWLWPKPVVNQEEIIPPQFAKIVLSQPQKSAGQEDAGGGKSASSTNKVQQTAVVQAFRAKALRNSINGLLKGGMTRLLTQSDYLVGTSGTNEARRMFDAKSSALAPTGTEVGLMNAKSVAVGSLGGKGGTGSGGDGSSVGYGTGHRAGVQGQGSSMVSMDLGNSLVEEGLTKDEVGEVIHKHMSEVRYCYEAAMLRTPGVEGRLIVNFRIAGGGDVKSSEVKSSTLPDPRLDDCILRRLVTWKFPKTKGGIEVAVSYPFIFKTLGR